MFYVYEKNSGEFYGYKSVNTYSDALNSIDQKTQGITTKRPPNIFKDWVWSDGSWVEPTYKDTRSIDEIRDSAWKSIKEMRSRTLTSDVFVKSVGKFFPTDSQSLVRYNNIGNMISLGNYIPIQWKVSDNTWVDLTEDVYLDLQRAIVERDNYVFQLAEEHKSKMLESDNPEEYDYSTGWNDADALNKESQ